MFDGPKISPELARLLGESPEFIERAREAAWFDLVRRLEGGEVSDGR